MANGPVNTTAALQRALTKGLGTCTSCQPQIEYLEELALACPEIDPSVTELRVMHDHLDKMCRVGLRGGTDFTVEEERQ